MLGHERIVTDLSGWPVIKANGDFALREYGQVGKAARVTRKATEQCHYRQNEVIPFTNKIQ
jgi:hypothetical protein